MKAEILAKKYYQQYTSRLNNASKSNDDTSDVSLHFSQRDIMIMEQALNERSITNLNDFKILLEKQINSMQDESFIASWKVIENAEAQFYEKCSNSITWHLLLKQIDPRINRSIVETLTMVDSIKAIAFRQAWYGSIIFQLYLALVFNREILNRIIRQNADSQEGIQNLQKLLNCHYIRHIRNSLAHGSFEIFAGGICFNDKKETVVATHSILENLSTWMNLIILQSMKITN